MAETRPGLDAFDPAARLVVASSVVAGNRAAALPRFSVTAKSPLTNGIGEARAEGPWGVALAEAGLLAIVVTGQSPRPSVLVVEAPTEPDGPATARLEPAQHLWGRDTTETADALENSYPGSHVLAIGPAGERLVRYASIVTDRSFAAPRMGLGAVLGSKRFKAIVLHGGRPPVVTDPEGLAEITGSYERAIPANPLTRWQHEPPGFGAWVGGVGMPGYLGLENYRTARFDDSEGYAAERFLDLLAWSDGGCPGCPNDCIKGFAPEATDEARAAAARSRTGGLHQEAIAALGPNLRLPSAADAIALNERCLRLGVDPVSFGFTVSFLMDARERALIAPRDIAGLDLRFGDTAGVRGLLEDVATRSDAGDLVAEGARRLAARVPSDAWLLALETKGLEMVSFEPRTQSMLALGYATSPIGPRYDFVEHDWDFDDVDPAWPHALELARPLGITELMPMAAFDDRKVRVFVTLSTLWSALDALNVCIFASAPTRILSLEEVARVVRTITGWETDADEVMAWGARRLQLMRSYNLREGLTSADDTLPDRFFDDPIDVGRFAGTTIDRDAFQAMVRGYYDAMGWDAAGVPTEATLRAHGLEWTIAMDNRA
jgi:aldehyde:ferredoxin oxidoreductase